MPPLPCPNYDAGTGVVMADAQPPSERDGFAVPFYTLGILVFCPSGAPLRVNADSRSSFHQARVLIQ
jgi:hypothetical protein